MNNIHQKQFFTLLTGGVSTANALAGTGLAQRALVGVKLNNCPVKKLAVNTGTPGGA
jgi:hypothetical protein